MKTAGTAFGERTMTCCKKHSQMPVPSGCPYCLLEEKERILQQTKKQLTNCNGISKDLTDRLEAVMSVATDVALMKGLSVMLTEDGINIWSQFLRTILQEKRPDQESSGA